MPSLLVSFFRAIHFSKLMAICNKQQSSRHIKVKIQNIPNTAQCVHLTIVRDVERQQISRQKITKSEHSGKLYILHCNVTTTQILRAYMYNKLQGYCLEVICSVLQTFVELSLIFTVRTFFGDFPVWRLSKCSLESKISILQRPWVECLYNAAWRLAYFWKA